MPSLFVLHKFWVQKNLHFWFIGPFCGCAFCQSAEYSTPDQPLFRFPKIFGVISFQKVQAKIIPRVSFGSMFNFTPEGSGISYVFLSFCAVCMVI